MFMRQNGFEVQRDVSMEEMVNGNMGGRKEGGSREAGSEMGKREREGWVRELELMTGSYI